MRIFILDGDFEPIHKLFVDAQVTGNKALFLTVKWIYTAGASALYVAAPVLTAGFVLSLFKGIWQNFLYQYFRTADEVYIISELNERSIELAKDIVNEERIARLDIEERKIARKGKWNKRKFAAKRKRIIVFAEVFDKSEERSFELISQAQALGALCFKRDIVDIGLKRKRLKECAEQKLYFIGEDEDENVEQALTMIEDCCKNKKYNTPRTQFYIFATTVESEALIDSVDNGEMIVRRINENKNLVYATLREPAVSKDVDNDFIFKHAVKEGDVYKLRVLIVGLGNYGMELLKTLCWSCQVTKYELEIYVFDKEGKAAERIARVAPELIENNDCHIPGAPYYKIIFGGMQNNTLEDNGIDVRTRTFIQRLDEIATGPISAAFITLGEDELNIETAMTLRSYFGQKSQQGGLPKSYRKIPKIYPVVYSPAKNRICSKNGGLENYEQKSYGITFIGNMEKRYSLEAIEQTELAIKGEAVHLGYMGLPLLEKVKSYIGTMADLKDALDKIGGDDVEDEKKEEVLDKVWAFFKDLKQSVDGRISKWKKELAKWAKELGEQDLNRSYLISKLGAVENELRDEPLNEWLKNEKSIYQKCIQMIDDQEEYESISNDLKEHIESKKSRNIVSLKRCLIDKKTKACKLLEQLENNIAKGRGAYYRYEYHRNSSMATAMHSEIRERALEVYYRSESLSDTPKRKKEVEELWAADKACCEHRRWMAYMWAEGYRYGELKSSISKTNSSLLPYSDVSMEAKEKTAGIVAEKQLDNNEMNASKNNN